MSLFRLLCLLTAFASQAGEFPIGLYGVPPDAPLDSLSEAGFTAILPSQRGPDVQRELAGRARRAGLDFIGYPDTPVMKSGPASEWPISAWYIADEPEVYRVSPSEIGRQAAELRRWDPNRSLSLVVGEGRYAADYAPSVDEVWVDWYPVPHLPLETVGREISLAVSSVTGKPVMAVLQAIDWKDYSQRDPKKPRIGRFPQSAEIRFMAYQALVRGASGVYFFEFQKRAQPGKTLLDFPEQWLALRRVSKEFHALRSFFSGSSHPLDLAGLEGRAWQAGGREIAVLLNPTSAPLHLPERFLTGEYWTLFEKRLSVKDRFPAGRLGPYRTAVLMRR